MLPSLLLHRPPHADCASHTHSSLPGLTYRVGALQAIEGAIRDEGWKMVMLLRLSPILPFALLNYGLSVTPISAWTYTWASAVGIIPGVLQLSPSVAFPHSAGASASAAYASMLVGHVLERSVLLCCAGTLLYVYVGSLANDIGELLSGRRKVSPVITIVSAVLSGIFIVAAFVVISVRAKRAISRYRHRDASSWALSCCSGSGS